jgi:hypothetical protein
MFPDGAADIYRARLRVFGSPRLFETLCDYAARHQGRDDDRWSIGNVVECVGQSRRAVEATRPHFGEQTKCANSPRV